MVHRAGDSQDLIFREAGTTSTLYNDNILKWAYGAYSHTAVHYYHATHADPGHDHTNFANMLAKKSRFLTTGLKQTPALCYLPFPWKTTTRTTK